MNIESSHIKVIEHKWPELKVERCLGRGYYGAVYECTKSSAGIVTKDAVKVIEKDFGDNVREKVELEGHSFDEYRLQVKQETLAEIQRMIQLKSPHIVHINDYEVAESEDGAVLYVLIRMDLLKPLDQYKKEHLNDTKEQATAFAAKVGCDICDALEVCHSHHLLHRDIKPENIFGSDKGDFYLGDFGVSKDNADVAATLSSTGTQIYMAHEMLLGQYDNRADLYSLGMVLYELTNHWRMPFYPPYPAKVPLEEKNAAYYKRMQGEQVPLPDNCTPELGKVIRKMCAFDKEDRFSNARQVKDAILKAAGAQESQASYVEEPAQENNKDGRNQDSNAGRDGRKTADDVEIKAADPAAADTKSGAADRAATGAKPGSVDPAAMDSGKKKQRAKKAKKSKHYKMVWIPFVAIIPVAALAVFILYQINGSNGSSAYEDAAEQTSVQQDTKDAVLASAAAANGSATQTAQEETIDDTTLLFSIAATEITDGTKVQNATDTLGNTYGQALRLFGENSNEAWATYYLGGKYKKLVGVVAADQEAAVGGQTTIQFLDQDTGDELYTMEVSRALEPTQVEVDVTNVKFVKIYTGDAQNVPVLFTEAVLYEDENSIPEETTPEAELAEDSETGENTVALNTLTPIEITEGTRVIDATDTIGNHYEKALRLYNENYQEAWATYYLGGKYTKLVGTVATDSQAVINQQSSMEFIDTETGNDLYKLDTARTLEPTRVEMDVTGVKFVKIYIPDATNVPMIFASGTLYRNEEDIPETTISNGMGETTDPNGVSLFSLTPVEMTDGPKVTDSSDTIGNTYENALCLRNENYGEVWVTYYLGGKYERLVGTVATDSAAAMNQTAVLEFINTDTNEDLYKIEGSRILEPTSIEIDVTGVSFLEIHLDNPYDVPMIFADAVLYGSADDIPAQAAEDAGSAANGNEEDKSEEGVSMLSLTPVENSNGFKITDAKDTVGNSYAKVLRLYDENANEGYVTYYLGGKYEKLTCLVATDEVAATGSSATLEFSDPDAGEALYQMDVSRVLEPDSVEIDVTGVKFVRIYASDVRNVPVIIADARLYVSADDVSGKTDHEGSDADGTGNNTAASDGNASSDQAESSGEDTSGTQKGTEAGQSEEVSLFSLTPTEITKGPKVTEATDSIGNTYEKALRLASDDAREAWATYYLGGKYSKLSGTIATDQAAIVGEQATIEMIDPVSGEVLYTLDASRVLEPTQIEIDVTNLKFVEIYVNDVINVPMIFADAVLSK